MIVRPRDADDLPALATALRAVHESDGYPVRWKADPAAWLTLTRLFVVLGARGAGVGVALLDTAVARARAQGRTAVLEVSPSDGPAVALSRRRWWRDAGDGPPRWWVPGGGPSLLSVAP